MLIFLNNDDLLPCLCVRDKLLGVHQMGGTFFQKVLAGAFLGGVVVMSRQMMRSAAADFGDIETCTDNVVHDPQFVEVLMFLRVDGIQSYVDLVRLADSMVNLYRTHLHNIAVNQASLSSQLKMQELHNTVKRSTRTYLAEVGRKAPEELETVQEHIITFEAVCQSYLDNTYQDSMNVVGGDVSAFERLEHQIQDLL